MEALEILRRAVEKHSQAEVATALEVGRPMVNRWLSGDRPFPPEHALYLAEWMGEPEPNHYELLAEATRHESRKRWLQKKARAVAGCSVLVMALGIVSPTLEARGINQVNDISTLYIMRISTAPYCN
ncbi:hypothetical protein [Algiphilus sp.]|uniref:hypothetical protein n=1 Tax=Algiphilus sp. TaxID=1872431 RepID=UPI003BAA2971